MMWGVTSDFATPNQRGEYEVPFGLYRAALVQVRAAERFSRSRKPERKLQEADAAATAVILIDASLETWVKSACESVNTGAHPNSRTLWRLAPHEIGVKRGVTSGKDLELPEKDFEFLGIMTQLRNYLVHGDARSRDKLATQFSWDPAYLLAHFIAAWASDGADSLFTYGMRVTGILAPTKKRLLEVHPDLLT